MNKTLQDNVWSILPKEFKEEVKRMWSVEVDCATKYHSELHKHRVDLLYELFGEHLHWQNILTSDAEGEEMLTAMKWKVQEQYANYNKELQHDGLRHIEYEKAKEVVKVLYYLFGSKCLRDELNEDNFAKSEPKPAEPKFKEGDRAIYCIPEKQRIKARVVNVRQRSGSTLFNTLFNYDIRLDDGRTANWVDEQWLLPDNDDQVRAVTEKASEQFDRIIKDDFKKQNRLNIAAMAMAGMIASPVDYHDDNIVKFALEYADALIAAAEKGGCQ